MLWKNVARLKLPAYIEIPEGNDGEEPRFSCGGGSQKIFITCGLISLDPGWPETINY